MTTSLEEVGLFIRINVTHGSSGIESIRGIECVRVHCLGVDILIGQPLINLHSSLANSKYNRSIALKESDVARC